MAKISACIISFNEEKKIEDCLKSLQSVVDEIIIVDSGSTDRTVEIARTYTDNIYNQTFEGYGKQKNTAASKASYNWILNLDCDERLSEQLQQAILTAKDNLDQADVWSMPRKTYYIYRWLNHCWYPDRKIRLYNRNKTAWNNVALHESIISDNMHQRQLSGDILHYSFDSISDHLKTIDHFTELAADDLIRKNKKLNPFSPLVHAAWIFIKIYFLNRGFLDGFAGLIVANLSCMHVFIKYSKAYIKRKSIKHRQV
ncbi:Glycosyl transferase [hydrothermal vent metagenome]|uniref:Glycosyl transferase n=1 Tax=hydrothermal vent metagenome TaxID=652676 RepID=A0A3B0WT51_9ZZZZ